MGENARGDWRDDLVSICLIYHAAIRVEMDVDELFNEVASISGPKVSDLMLEFLRREPELKSLEAFLYGEQTTANGIVYVEVPWEYRPPTTSDKLKQFLEEQMPGIYGVIRRVYGKGEG